jgi:hypothetical protein
VHRGLQVAALNGQVSKLCSIPQRQQMSASLKRGADQLVLQKLTPRRGDPSIT